jgi:hypothetical protein
MERPLEKEISPQEFNKKVAARGSYIRQKLKRSVSSLTSKGKGDLLKSLKLKTKKDYGEIDRLTYQFARHGVFLHKGVGRGYIMQNGTVVRGQKPDQARKSYASAKGREIKSKVLSSPIKRKPTEWFNPVLETEIPKLADMITEMRADAAVNASRFLIK